MHSDSSMIERAELLCGHSLQSIDIRVGPRARELRPRLLGGHHFAFVEVQARATVKPAQGCMLRMPDTAAEACRNFPAHAMISYAPGGANS